MENDSMDLGSTNVLKLFKGLFIPTLMGMLSISAVTTIDGVIVGHGVGSQGIAAINISYPPLMLFTGIGLMLGGGCSVVASICLSNGKKQMARTNVTQSLVFATALSLLPCLFIMAFPEFVAGLMGSSDTLLPMVKEYMFWSVPAVVFQMWTFISLFVIRLDGAPKYAMFCSVVPSILNILLDYLFVFPLGWGLMGAAFATSISSAIGGLMAISYLLFHARQLRLTRIKLNCRSMRFAIRNLWHQSRIGFSAMLTEVMMAILMIVGNITFLKYLGDEGVGAYGIACYYIPYVFMVGNAIAQSAQPIISYNWGLKSHKRVKDTERIALITSIVCGGLVMLMFLTVPTALVALFIDTNSKAAAIAIDGLPYFSLAFVFSVLNISAIGYYQSIERIVPATVYALCRGIVFLIPCYIVLPQLMGVHGIWLALAASEITTTVVIALALMKEQFASKRKRLAAA